MHNYQILEYMQFMYNFFLTKTFSFSIVSMEKFEKLSLVSDLNGKLVSAFIRMS